MGSPDFAVPSLEILISDNHNIPAVVTTIDKKKGRGLKFQYSPVKDYCVRNGINVLQPENLKDESFIEHIKKLNPDLIIVVAFRILPKILFEIPKYGSINLHASLLPKYRGAAPINWAIIKGEKITGLTTFFLNDKVDTGNIILQEKYEILNEDNYGTLYKKLAIAGANLLKKTVDIIDSGNYNLLKQDESEVSPAPKIKKENCKINWDLSSVEIHNFIRGLSPSPGSFTNYNGKFVKIYKSQLTDIISENNKGTIVIADKRLYVCTNDMLIEILDLQLEGKNKITSKEFINGIDKSGKHKFD